MDMMYLEPSGSLQESFNAMNADATSLLVDAVTAGLNWNITMCTMLPLRDALLQESIDNERGLLTVAESC